MISILNKRATICANGFTVRADGSRHKAQWDDNLQDAFLKVTKFAEEASPLGWKLFDADLIGRRCEKMAWLQVMRV